MQVETTLLRALPVLGNALVDVCLVENLGDQLRLVVDGARVRGRQLSTKNRIVAAGCDQEAEQGPHAVYREAKHQDGDDDEDGDASPHGLVSSASFIPRGTAGPS